MESPHLATCALSLSRERIQSPRLEHHARLALSEQERVRYMASLTSHLPFKLDVLRWNHDSQQHTPHDEESVEEENKSSNVQLQEALQIETDRNCECEAFEQLQCLASRFRVAPSGRPSGGMSCHREAGDGVFLRHNMGNGLIWIPPVGCNFLVFDTACSGWFLVELAKLVSRRVALDTKTGQLLEASVGVFPVVDKERSAETESSTNQHAEVAVLLRWHPRAKLHSVNSQLTDRWLEAADDLKKLWTWDWRPVRAGSNFQFAQRKLGLPSKTAPADITHGFFGEKRWEWHWEEDEAGRLDVRNISWQREAQLYMSATSIEFVGIGGEHASWC